ncbi:MAG: hypothetical protein U1F77_03660 [Kiritimatiellia bacterium]
MHEGASVRDSAKEIMRSKEFAVITRRVITKDGFEEFQPTAYYPERREVKSLAGLPTDIDPEEAVLDWAFQGADNDEEFIVAFKISDACFRVVRWFDSTFQHAEFQINEHYT